MKSGEFVLQPYLRAKDRDIRKKMARNWIPLARKSAREVYRN